jgi:hypothetical protein
VSGLVVAFIFVTLSFPFWIGFVCLDVNAVLQKRNFSRQRLSPIGEILQEMRWHYLLRGNLRAAF